MEDINVALGTTRNELDLPREVEVTLVDKTKLNLGIQWDNGTPEYDADIPGEYFFIGNLILVEGVINTNNLVAWVKVIIAVGDANTISLSANPSDGGIVSGGGLYAPGKAITVKATPKEGYTFTNWEEDGEEVSQDSHYSFTVTADRCLVANFAEVEVPVIEPVVISPENIYFNKNHPATVILNIRWGSANRVIGITGKAMGGALLITLEENKHYTVTDFDDGTAALNISPNFTALLPIPITMVPDGTELLLNIAFNTGETKEVIFRVISGLSYISTVSVSIDNHPNARPQSGLNEADMVYETAVAPGITRFLAVFDLYKPVDKIGPVRSARTHLVQLASEHRGAFAHCGGSPDSFNFISRSPLMDFDEMYGSGSYFFRSTAGQIAPYNLYTSTGLMNRGIVERGGTVSESIGYTRGDMPGGKAESQISVQFPGQDYEIDYIWNGQNQNYERSEKGNRLVLDNESIVTANNIVVIYAPHEQMYRQDIREWVINPNIMGAGKACFYRDGKEWHGEWTKQSLSSPMSFMVNGEPFKFAPGNIWVLVVPKRHYEVELTSGWNTLSIPLKLEKDTISEIVDVSNIDIIYAYDSMNKRWIEADAGMRLHPMDAIYIKANNNNISPAKLIPYNDLSIGYTKQINKGWNLIGPALNIGSMDGYKMEANRVLASLNNKYSQVISQNVGNQFGWVYVNGDWRAPYMFAGKGYWVYAFEDTELAGFSSTPVNAIYEGTNIYPYPPGGGGGGGGGGSSPVEPTTNLSQNVSAIPELPIAFFGSVNFEDGDAVSEGTIDVLIDGNVIASKNFTNGQYGLTLGDRLIVEEMYFHYADMVQFRVNGMNAVHETIIDWSNGKLQELNLVVSQDYERLFYQYLKIRTPNTVEIIFNQAIANNLKNDSELKKEILFTNDGINYRTLSEQDIIEINDNKLIIRFFENLSGSQNRIRIAAHAFKDREGSLLNEEVITNTFEARVIDECFIATAAFGSKLTPAVSLLRQFRDTKLLTNKAGTAFVNYYYTNSPKIAEIIANNEGLRLVVRILLLPIIAFVWMIMNAKIALVILILLAFYMIITNRARFLGVFRRS